MMSALEMYYPNILYWSRNFVWYVTWCMLIFLCDSGVLCFIFTYIILSMNVFFIAQNFSNFVGICLWSLLYVNHTHFTNWPFLCIHWCGDHWVICLWTYFGGGKWKRLKIWFAYRWIWLWWGSLSQFVSKTFFLAMLNCWWETIITVMSSLIKTVRYKCNKNCHVGNFG